MNNRNDDIGSGLMSSITLEQGSKVAQDAAMSLDSPLLDTEHFLPLASATVTDFSAHSRGLSQLTNNANIDN